MTGVIAYIEPLSVSDADGALQGTEAIGEGVNPPTASQSTSQDSFSLSLTFSQDPNVDLYCKYMILPTKNNIKYIFFFKTF